MRFGQLCRETRLHPGAEHWSSSMPMLLSVKLVNTADYIGFSPEGPDILPTFNFQHFNSQNRSSTLGYDL
jgi:hypothetical protein